jgi:hypothetical protein
MNFRAVVSPPCQSGRRQERVVSTQRSDDNGALSLAAAAGYFKGEGIDLAMTAYESDRMVTEALASGVTDFALTGFTPAAFNFAGKSTIKAIPARTREKRYYEGTELVVSNIGFSKGRGYLPQDSRDRCARLDLSLSAGADRTGQESRHEPCHGEADADTRCHCPHHRHRRSRCGHHAGLVCARFAGL